MPESIHKTIADGVKAIVDSLNLVGMTCKVRAEVNRGEGDPMPFCIVTMGAEHHDRYLTGGNVLRLYEIAVSFFAVSNQKLETSIGDSKLNRQRVRQAIEPDGQSNSALTAIVPAVYDVVAADMPDEDSGAFAANYQTARLGLIIKTSETIRGN